jgi:type I restriction enzyme S subunit
MKNQINQPAIEWKETPLGKIANFINGRAFKPEEWEEKGKIIIRIQDLTGSVRNPNYTTKKFDDKYLVKKGDLLISWSATLDAFIWGKDEGWLNQHIFKVEEDKKIIDHKYLFYFVKRSIDLFLRDTHGSTMKHITKGNFESIKIPLPFRNGQPDIESQKAIVSILEKAEQLKEKRKQSLKLLDEYLKSLFNEMFVGKGFPIKKLEGVCIKITDGSHRTPQLLSEGYPFLTVADMGERDFDYRDIKKISKEEYLDLVKNGCRPEKGDVLFSKDGTIGKVMRINETKDQVVLSSISILKPDFENINSIYLENVLKTDLALNQAIDSKSGSAIRRIILRHLKEIKIPLPPLSLQQKFASIVEHVERLKEKQNQSLKEIEQLFNALMQKAFNGELVR